MSNFQPNTKCFYCEGEGRVNDGHICGFCNGTGIEAEHKFDFDIPDPDASSSPNLNEHIERLLDAAKAIGPLIKTGLRSDSATTRAYAKPLSLAWDEFSQAFALFMQKKLDNPERLSGAATVFDELVTKGLESPETKEYTKQVSLEWEELNLAFNAFIDTILGNDVEDNE